ncbi:hypothetical protein GTZ78_10835 [Streptomyces sp. SID8361]|uniref:hydroxyacid dehydrogenase n=1 Tax=Streptomyces sp. MnatMP-M27 TaxID=1839768 RepID=UPI00081F582E|nr:hydroxyacid dehydrogenase [Streptomyces sp. MnatMP-M27]MYU11174.1 hypothetical protein [Streptomyces sp. SID8361]SCF78915.1 Phosphoglycerate dehydrogenase [Streptomyces sp. MnatMP-M27]
MDNQTIVLALPPDERGLYFDDDLLNELGVLGRVVVSSPTDFPREIGDATVLISNSSLPSLTGDIVARAPGLRLLAHTGSTVKRIMTPEAWQTGIRVVLGGSEITESVAETAVEFTIALLHRTNRIDHALRTGRSWQEARDVPLRRMVDGAKVGVIGASRIGRAYLRRMQALGADIAVTDPYLDAETAEQLGVRVLDLDDLLRESTVVSLHAPVTESTIGLIGAQELALMADGSVLVNTARAALLDGTALLAELRTGRIDAALDVHDHEPLPAESEYRTLSNVLLTAHTAGNTLESRRAAGRKTVQHITRFCRGEALGDEVTEAMLATMA